MSRYLLKFHKLGMIRYTSHLDMIRLFQRVFKRNGIALEYSKGFNPHPKLSFAHPLSLGHTSVGEYLEFETLDSLSPTDIFETIRSNFPDGIWIESVLPLPKEGKSIASLVEFASYELQIPLTAQDFDNNWIQRFLEQDTMLVSKRQKKDHAMIDVDIKPHILKLESITHNDGRRIIFALIKAGSKANLNPELIIQAMGRFLNLPDLADETRIKRLDLYASRPQTKETISLLDIDNYYYI